jgi:hypothetical protein
LSNLDTFLAKLLNDRDDVVTGIKRRVRKLALAVDPAHARVVGSPGDLAEYHAQTGLDDGSIARVLEQLGFSVDLVRFPVGRTAAVRWPSK